MPKAIKPLSDTKCRAHKYRPDNLGENKLRDGGGLYLDAAPNGRKVWRLDYRNANGKRNTATLAYEYGREGGSLTEARAWRSSIKALLAQGLDPNQHAQQQKQAKSAEQLETFGASADEWIEHKSKTWSEGNTEKVRGIVDRVLMPWLRTRPMRDIQSLEVLHCLQRYEKADKLETAHKARAYAAAIFRRGIVHGACQHNPVDALKDALRPKTSKNFAHIVDPVRIGELLRAMEHDTGRPQTVSLLKLCPYTFTRPSELRTIRWSDVDLDGAMLIIPEGRLGRKGGGDHAVPLSVQAIELFRELEPLTKHAEDAPVFASPTKPRQPLSPSVVNKALERLGYKDEMTAHGFRHLASTRLHEMNWPSHVIEAQLSHKDGNTIRATYNKAQYLDERRKLMQAWADYLGSLKAYRGENVTPIRKGAV